MILAILILFYDFTKPPPDPIQIIYAQNNQDISETKNNSVSFTISGAVNQPGTYSLPAGSIIMDGIKAAGDFTSEANITNSDLNLGSLISNQQTIHIPENNENDMTIANEPAFFVDQNIKSNLININTAAKQDLMELNGVGESTAQKIIDYRSTNPFDTIEELMEVKGIGEKSFAKIKDMITI